MIHCRLVASTDSTVAPETEQQVQHTSTTRAPQELEEEHGDNKETRHIRKEFLRSASRSLPHWGRFLNRVVNMPIITHADAKHVHAISGATWFLTAYPLMFYALYREIAFIDWSTFASFSGILQMDCLASVLMGVTSIPMRPTRKSFRHYSIAMRLGMVSFPLCSSMSIFLALSAQTVGGIGEVMGEGGGGGGGGGVYGFWGYQVCSGGGICGPSFGPGLGQRAAQY